MAPQRLVVLRDAGSSRQQLHGLGAAALARAIHLGQRGRSEHQRPGTEGPISALLLRQRRQVRQGPFRVCTQAREDVPAVGDQETADSLVLYLVLEDVHLLQEEAKAVGMDHPRRRLPVEPPELRQHFADQPGDDAAVAGHILEIDQPQRRAARVGGHTHGHPIDGAEHHAARRGRQFIGVFEERPGIREEVPLALRDAPGKAIAEGIDLRRCGPLGEKLAEGGELALLLQLV